MNITVFVDDNFHYMDPDERYELGQFDTLVAALVASKAMVDDYLASAFEPGMTAAALYSNYTMFGEDPWISGVETDFSGWSYAKALCEAICNADTSKSSR